MLKPAALSNETTPLGGTPLNNPPIEIHANSLMFAFVFLPHVTIFWIFWLHECLKWRLKFNSKLLFWCQSKQIFEVRAIEQCHHEFQMIHMPPHQFWPRPHATSFLSGRWYISYMHFFYRHFKGLHQMGKDLVLCAHYKYVHPSQKTSKWLPYKRGWNSYE